MSRVDYLEADDGDLLFEDGDLVIGQSDQNHIYDIISSAKGDWREYPLLGANAILYRNKAISKAEFVRSIKEELKKDGYQNVQVTFSGELLSDFTVKVK